MSHELINSILKENSATSNMYRRNLIKEYLQVLAMSFIYGKREYQDLVFYGGSCLRHCYGLPRLSEDLDFIDKNKSIKLEDLREDIKPFFKKELGIEPNIRQQKFRLYLKFPLLYDLKLAKIPESNFLNIKIEVYKGFYFNSQCKIEIIPIFKFGKSILVRALDLSSLMSTKIQAILNRKWEKRAKDGSLLAIGKGRDYYDLMWYLTKNIKPNVESIYGEKKTIEDLKTELSTIIRKIDTRTIALDLEGLIDDPLFIKDLAKNIKEILIGEVKKRF